MDLTRYNISRFHKNSYCISYHIKNALKKYSQSLTMYVHVVFITRFTFSPNALLMIATGITENLTNNKIFPVKMTFCGL